MFSQEQQPAATEEAPLPPVAMEVDESEEQQQQAEGEEAEEEVTVDATADSATAATADADADVKAEAAEGGGGGVVTKKRRVYTKPQAHGGALKVGRPRKRQTQVDPQTGRLVIVRERQAQQQQRRKAEAEDEEDGGGGKKRARAAGKRKATAPSAAALAAAAAGGGVVPLVRTLHLGPPSSVMQTLVQNKAGALFRNLLLTLSYFPDAASRVPNVAALTPAFFQEHGLEAPLVIADSTGLGPERLVPDLWPAAKLVQLLSSPPAPSSSSSSSGGGRAAASREGKGSSKGKAATAAATASSASADAAAAAAVAAAAAAATAAAFHVLNGLNQRHVELPLKDWLVYWDTPVTHFHRKFAATADITGIPASAFTSLSSSSSSASSSGRHKGGGGAAASAAAASLPYPSFLPGIDWGHLVGGEGAAAATAVKTEAGAKQQQKQPQSQSQRKEEPQPPLKGRMGVTYAVEGFYRDFDLTAGGASQWLHVAKGTLAVLLVPPTDTNVAVAEAWAKDKEGSLFLPLYGIQPKRMQRGEPPSFTTTACCHRLLLQKGETLLLPPAWLYATYSVSDTAVLSGRFHTSYSGQLMTRALDLEAWLGKAPSISLAEKHLCFRLLARHLREEARGLTNARERAAVRSLLTVARHGIAARSRKPQPWEPPAGVLPDGNGDDDPLAKLDALLKEAEGSEAAPGFCLLRGCRWCDMAKAATQLRAQAEREAVQQTRRVAL